MILKFVIYHEFPFVTILRECMFYAPIETFNNLFTSLVLIHSHGTHKAVKGDLFILKVNTTQSGKKLPNMLVQFCETIWILLGERDVFNWRLKKFYLSLYSD